MQLQTPESRRHVLIGSLMVLAAAITVSSKAIIVKLAYAYPVDAATLIALRMAFALPFFIALLLWGHATNGDARISKRDAWAIAILGVVGGYGPMWLDFAGLAYVTAGLERIILFLYPTMVVILSAVLYKQRIGKREMLALALSYAGVGLVVGHDLFTLKSAVGHTMLGASLVAASAFVYAAYLVASGRLIPRVGSSLFTAYTMLAATLASGLHFASSTHAVSILQLPAPVYWLSLLMAVVATVLPAILLNAGIHRIGSNQASLVSSIGPVSTIFLASIFLGEGITLLQLAGTGLVIAGVLIITIKSR
ncbi:MAG: DMT family transporter [Candidatus Methylopumilus sp.]